MSCDDNVLKVEQYLENCDKFYVKSRRISRDLLMSRRRVSDSLKVLEKKGVIIQHNDSKNRKIWKIRKRENAH